MSERMWLDEQLEKARTERDTAKRLLDLSEADFKRVVEELLVLRARVAKLEAALIEARIFLEGELEVREMAGEWPNSEYLDAPRRLIERLDAVLKDAPQ